MFYTLKSRCSFSSVDAVNKIQEYIKLSEFVFSIIKIENHNHNSNSGTTKIENSSDLTIVTYLNFEKLNSEHILESYIYTSTTIVKIGVY